MEGEEEDRSPTEPGVSEEDVAKDSDTAKSAALLHNWLRSGERDTAPTAEVLSAATGLLADQDMATRVSSLVCFFFSENCCFAVSLAFIVVWCLLPLRMIAGEGVGPAHAKQPGGQLPHRQEGSSSSREQNETTRKGGGRGLPSEVPAGAGLRSLPQRAGGGGPRQHRKVLHHTAIRKNVPEIVSKH